MPELTDDTSTQLAAPTGLTRRAALRVAAVSGAGAAVLAACGGGDQTGTAAEDSTPASSDPSDSGTPDGEAGGGLVATADVPVGGGIVLEAEKVVVTQPAEGTFKAFTAVCTHQACTVASVKNDRISCPCHGSVYSAEDGSVINGPAPRPLAEIPISVEGDQVVRS